MQKNHPKAMLRLLTAMVIYGTIGIVRRYLPGFSSAFLACFRGASGALFLLLIALALKKPCLKPIPPRIFGGLALSGALMGLNWILLFEAYNYTSVAVATLCYYMEPTLLILLSAVFLHEKLTGRKVLCAGIAVAGMVLVSGVTENGIPAAGEMQGILLGLGAALLYALVIMLNKKITGIDSFQKTILQLFFASAALIPYLLIDGGWPSAALTPQSASILLLLGLVHTALAYALYFGSIEKLRTHSIAILSYLDPVTALILSAIVLHETMTIPGIIGAVLILGTAAVSELIPDKAS